FRAIEFLGRHNIPFVRFWASYFDNRKPYREDPRRYWHNMDLLVAACERARVGLIPTLFWNAWNVPFDFDEFRSAWLDEDSRTRRYAAQYTREFVTRYRNRSIIWAWEFANEDNLAWDLPNAIALLPEGRKDNRNIVRSMAGMVAVRAFAREVRALDRTRPISSGASEVRPAQYRIATMPFKPGEHWGEDTPEQALEATSWTAPAPVDLLSMHHYEAPGGYDPAATRAWLRTAGERARALKRPLFLGEFGILGHWTPTPANFDDAGYRAALSDYFDALCESRAALAAYWAFTADSRQFTGAAAPDYDRFNYVFDLIAAYNRKCAGRFISSR
ncbi:MAG: hypothetical protein JST11_05485, partial [Acidobacteria bacterium]|nr:hypothetical protein [Acidobacteriota bacterium]